MHWKSWTFTLGVGLVIVQLISIERLIERKFYIRLDFTQNLNNYTKRATDANKSDILDNTHVSNLSTK